MSASPDWPDWTGRACAIVASGPSAKTAGIGRLAGRGLAVIAIKENHELAPFADAVYGCDWPWWRNAQGLPGFTGLKMAWDDKAVDRFGLIKVRIQLKTREILLGETGLVGDGGNSAFHALNLAVQFGARRILMVGLDLHDRSGKHWYGRANGPGRANPDDSNFRKWIAHFTAAAPVLAGLGCEVVNASPISDLRCWPRRSIADTLSAWEAA